MKTISSILFTLGLGAALTSAAPSLTAAAEQPANLVSKAQATSGTEFSNSAVRLITPQKDLESAIRGSEKGDILLMGPDGWYRIESKTLQQGTKMYILSAPGTSVSAFPKESATGPVR